jgi:hypothetical protein
MMAGRKGAAAEVWGRHLRHECLHNAVELRALVRERSPAATVHALAAAAQSCSVRVRHDGALNAEASACLKSFQQHWGRRRGGVLSQYALHKAQARAPAGSSSTRCALRAGGGVSLPGGLFHSTQSHCEMMKRTV